MLKKFIYIRDAYGSRYRVLLEDLESKKVFIPRYNNRGELVLGKDFRPEIVMRGNIVGPWHGCIADFEEYSRNLDLRFGVAFKG